MSKRVFQLAKEMGVKSSAIVEKCQAEEIPNITNHMSSVSAGLEATVREWFSMDEAGGTAVEVAERVDLDKVRVAPKARRAAANANESASDEDDAGITTAVVDSDPPAYDEPPAPLSTQTKATPGVPAGADEEQPTNVGDEPAPEAPRELRPAAAASLPSKTEKKTETRRPAGQTEAVGEPQMNVPSRPDVVKPAGPRLEVQRPARLSGPKVVRVEAPDVIQAPRARRGPDDSFPASRPPRGGGGAGTPLPDEGDRSTRRNKRRAGPAGPAPAPPQQQRGRRGGRSGGDGQWSERDLIEREARLSRSEGFLRQRRRDQKLKQQSTHERAASAAETGGVVRIGAPFTIKDISAATGVKSAEMIKKLFLKGIMASPATVLDEDQAQELLLDYNIELVVETQATAVETVKQEFKDRKTVDERSRSPIVTILGHVDHGKTSLLDKIRNANVAAGEAGGITQATSAFRVHVKVGDEDKSICFLDTPGHEAFTEMRSRGANLTDIVVLVVAADDGVMPQTIESISHAKAAGVPVIVAINKIDVPGATDDKIQRLLGQLAEHGLNPTEWGGDTEVVRTSAITGQGIQELLEALDYQAQLLEFKADFKGPAGGVVVEARVVEGRGAVANLLIQQGELKVGDILVAGRAYGRVRDITDDRGERIKVAYPATPIQISGLDEVPSAGDKFYVVKDLKRAQQAAEHRREADRERQLAQPKITLDRMFAQMEEQQIKELLIVLKADVQGSVDVIRKALEDVTTDAVKVRVLHAAVGGITESDITLAAASNAVVLGFNVIPSGKARQLAELRGIEIRSYRVIYDIVDDMKRAAEGLLEPELREDVLGHAEVRQVFKISRVGAIAGCYVTDGTIERNALIRVTRGDIVVEHDRVLEQLKRFKDDAKDVRAGQECGMKIVGYDDIKEGDILECYRKIEVKRSL